MTIYEFCVKHCADNFMAEKDAQSAIATAINGMPEMEGRWNDDIEGYPPYLLSAVLIALDGFVVEWIDTNKPLVFYRPLFVR